MALPFLPGMSFNDPKKNSFARTQSLNYRNGVAVHDGRARPAKDAYSAAPPPPAWKTASGEVPPPWLAYEKKVLKFDAYFMESIPYSREPYRVRKCTIMYHLEDGTLSVTEAKVQNSGLPQGILVRRHRATKDDGTMLSYQDINTCMDLKIHGVKYRIYETTDPYTLQFMEEMGYPVAGFEDCPGDPHTEQREAMTRSMRPVRPPKSGKDPLRQFLDHDGKVLRFYCLMDDPRNRHERRTFMLQFFLADDTLSVVENLPANCGRDASPVFAKRQAPPKGFPTLEEIRIGQMLSIFNHKFMIYDVDKFTREYYRENYGEEDFIPIDVSITYQDAPQMEIPKYNGFGTEADSLNTCLSLVPKPIKRNIQKSIENDKKILRFGAKLNSNKPIDATRTFVICYFLADDTISVYEPPQRNSGIVGGKFLERRRVKRPLKPPTLAPPLPPSSPARPHTSPNQTSIFQTSDFSLSRPSSTQQPTRSSRASTPSPTSSPTLSRSASPFSVTNRAFGYATTSGGYGHNPRSQNLLATQPRAETPPSLPSTPPRSPSRTPPATPPARQSPTQRREVSFSAQTTPLSTLARSLREESKPRTAASHEELESEYYTASDFYVGGLIQIFHHVFVLQDADEFALKHMEAHPDEFPVSDINRIMSRIRDEMETKWEVTSEWLRELDPARTGYIPRDSFKDLVHSICPDLKEQEVLTVCRRYDLDGKGQISYEEFYTAVAPRDDF